MSLTWTFGGTDLTTFGKILQIDGWGDIPERRGSDQVIPFDDGEMHAGKYYDKRLLDFYMSLTTSSASDMDSKLDTLRQLISLRTQQTLSVTREDGKVMTTQAIVNSRLQINRITNTLLKYVIPFSLPTPYFRLSTAISDNTTTINTSPKAMTVTNPGTAIERYATITLTGPLSNTVITNSTTGVSLTYTGTIAGGEVVVISTSSLREKTAVKDGVTNVIGNVTHNGAAAFMVINPGSNTLSITDGTATTGTVKIAFNAPYF